MGAGHWDTSCSSELGAPMVRTIARFHDQRAAFAAIESALSASFPAESLHLYAIAPDHSRKEVPIAMRSYVPHGFALGALVAAPVGIYLALQYGSSPLAGMIFAGGTGAMVGASMGLGSWWIGPSKRHVPPDVASFVITVDAAESHAPVARALLERAGGRDASLQTV